MLEAPGAGVCAAKAAEEIRNRTANGRTTVIL
jgi:hypothetical protein